MPSKTFLLLALALLAVSVHTTNLYLVGSQLNSFTGPACVGASNLGALRYTPIFPTAETYLRDRGISPFLVLLFCQGNTGQDHVIVYVTGQGIVKLKIAVYSNGYGKVTQYKLLDSQVGIDREQPQPY